MSTGILKIAVVACAATVVGGLSNDAAARVTVWHVAGYSYKYEESAQSSQPLCEGRDFSTTDGYDLRSETATLTMSRMTDPWSPPVVGPPEVIAYQRHDSGPSTLKNPFGGTAVVHRNISREQVQCADGSVLDNSCANPRTIDFGYQRELDIGSIWVATDRRRSRVTVRVTGWFRQGGDPIELLACPSDPVHFALGPPVTRGYNATTLRKTVPLKAFTHRTTTIALKRTLTPPEDAAKRHMPLSNVTISARITLRRSVANSFCSLRPGVTERLFVCTPQF